MTSRLAVPFTTLRIELKTFDSAHQLPQHFGKCRNLHGHTYKVFVEVVGPIRVGDRVDAGMVIDFGVIKTLWNEQLHPKLDHALLLGTEPLPWNYDPHDVGVGKIADLPIPYTTAEHLATWLFTEFDRRLDDEDELGETTLKAVEVYETPTSMARADATTWGVIDNDE